MPVVLREGPYEVSVFCREHGEPPHVHVWRDGRRAKFWLLPLELADGGRFKPFELRRMHRMLAPHEAALFQKWQAIHG
jgi:hypothetical protein